jgi:small subunit ribosomal protein S16
MTLSIRLTRVGRRKSPFYRLVVADSRAPRDGRFIEIIGHYQPLKKEMVLEVNEERALHWLHVGAQPSDTARSLLRRKNIMRRWHEERLAARKARKSAAAAETSAAGEPQPAERVEPPPAEPPAGAE